MNELWSVSDSFQITPQNSIWTNWTQYHGIIFVGEQLNGDWEFRCFQWSLKQWTRGNKNQIEDERKKIWSACKSQTEVRPSEACSIRNTKWGSVVKSIENVEINSLNEDADKMTPDQGMVVHEDSNFIRGRASDVACVCNRSVTYLRTMTVCSSVLS